MIATRQELFTVLHQYNPWWQHRRVPDLPAWRRTAFGELRRWLSEPPAARAVLLSGARQVGKTTLLLQAIQSLIADGVAPEKILYATLDHPLLKLLKPDELVSLWHEVQPRTAGPEYLLLDEIQYAKDWPVWLKHQVDFEKGRRIAVTGSAIPLGSESPESGVGRWHTIRLPTLSFIEYLQIKNVDLPKIPGIATLAELFSWPAADFIRTGQTARPLVAHFHEYLVRGGYPQTAQIESISLAQKLLREDIVDKVLKRDMTALYGVRRVLELEKTFLYLCLHDGGILDMPALCANLSVKKPTANGFLDLLEAAHLIYRLAPFGYGKEVLRARYKVYLADPAIAGSILLKGKSLIEDGARLGTAVEAAIFKHIIACAATAAVNLSYWRDRQDHEVDILTEAGGDIVPFEVKYTQGSVEPQDLKGLHLLCEKRQIRRACVISRDTVDFRVSDIAVKPAKRRKASAAIPLLKLPAPLACYWLSGSGTLDGLFTDVSAHL